MMDNRAEGTSNPAMRPPRAHVPHGKLQPRRQPRLMMHSHGLMSHCSSSWTKWSDAAATSWFPAFVANSSNEACNSADESMQNQSQLQHPVAQRHPRLSHPAATDTDRVGIWKDTEPWWSSHDSYGATAALQPTEHGSSAAPTGRRGTDASSPDCVSKRILVGCHLAS